MDQGSGGASMVIDSSDSSSVCSGDNWTVETHEDLRLGGELGGSGDGVNFVVSMSGCPRPRARVWNEVSLGQLMGQ